MKTIYERLIDYSNSDYYGFHMPGHKRNMGISSNAAAFPIDITEIEGFDDLHHAEGILREAQERAARLYGADETHFLVNGSTAGILSSILGVTNKGDKILVARNCHKSVYHAVYMNELNPVYVYPGFDDDMQINTEISAEDIRRALCEEPSARAVVIVSPTYDGVVSDVREIAAAAHEKGIPLIVDEAHGAHFGFHPYFPGNSNKKDADIVIHSVHKTLPSLTQTALLHMNGGRFSREKVRRYLHMLQTSSPSYVLMAGIDSCMDMLERRREEVFCPYVERLKKARERLSVLERIELAGHKGADPSKIILSAYHTSMTGKELYDMFLYKYHLQMEMYAGSYVLAMTSVGDTEEGFERLVRAARGIDAAIEKFPGGTMQEIKGARADFRLPRLPGKCTSAELEQKTKAGGEVYALPWEKSAGYISLEYAYLYPPGIPLIVPGEEITEEAAECLSLYGQRGCRVEGLKIQGQIEVWAYGQNILYHG